LIQLRQHLSHVNSTHTHINVSLRSAIIRDVKTPKSHKSRTRTNPGDLPNEQCCQCPSLNFLMKHTHTCIRCTPCESHTAAVKRRWHY